MASPVSPLSMSDNLINKMLTLPEYSSMVYATDFGYNKIQQITEIINRKAGGSQRVHQQKFEMYKMGNIGVAQTISGVSSSGVTQTGNLIVTFTQANQNFRVRDIIGDSNLAKGKVERVINSTQVEISPVNVTFSTSTHFTAGQVAKVLFDASPNRGSRGKTSLTYTPDTDYGYTGVTRDSDSMYIADGIKSKPMWKDKYWYTSQQTSMLRRFARQNEYKYYTSERAILNAGTKDETYLTGGLRWNIMYNGGTYLPLTGKITRDEFHDFINTMMLKSTTGKRRVVALMGQQFLSDLQDLNRDAITYSGNRNTFGGLDVVGFDTQMYAAAGMELEFSRFSLVDDPTIFPEISSITGKRRWSTSCLILDLGPIESADGSGMMAPIQKRHFGRYETRFKYLPGMMGFGEIGDDGDPAVGKVGDYDLAVSDLDAIQWEVYENSGLYMVPEKCGLIELVA